MAFCGNCGYQLADGAKFCYRCGTKAGNGASAQREQRRVGFEGEIRKCPECGESINAFMSVCPSCGHEFRGSRATSIVHEFACEIGRTIEAEEKEDLIRRFYVPNTREDIIEFFILAISNIEADEECRDAWAAKMEQTYQKAKLTFGSTKEFTYLDQLYQKKIKLLRKKRTLGTTRRTFGEIGRAFSETGKAIAKFCIILVIVAGVVMMAFGGIKAAESGDDESPYILVAGLGMIVMAVGLISFMEMIDSSDKTRKSGDKKRKARRNNFCTSAGKDASDLEGEDFEDAMEWLSNRGFTNISIKAERKGIFDTDGTIKGISIAGNTEFEKDDEFNKDAKILIRYYSKDC